MSENSLPILFNNVIGIAIMMISLFNIQVN